MFEKKIRQREEQLQSQRRFGRTRSDERPLRVETFPILLQRVEHPPRELCVENQGDRNERHQMAQSQTNSAAHVLEYSRGTAGPEQATGSILRTPGKTYEVAGRPP